MTPPIKSILCCLGILATASDIHTKQIRELEAPQDLLLLHDKTIVFGEGIEPRTLPMVAYSLEKGILDTFVFIESSRCDFLNENVIGTSVLFKTIKQLTSNKLLILRSVADLATVRTIVLLISMDSCSAKSTFDQSWPLSSQDFVTIVSFVNGYDIITSKNNRISFDADGFPHGDPQFFPVNSTVFSISTVSETARDEGYFIIDYTHQVVKFTKPDETKKGYWKNGEWLYIKDAQVLSNSEHSLYSVCAFNPLHKIIVTCYQFDKLGNEKLIRAASLEFDRVLDVRSLAGGGFVFATFKSKGNILSFVKIGIKLEQVYIWSYSGKQTFEGAKLLEYNEKNHMFILAYKTSQVRQGIAENAVVSHMFSLEN